MPENESVRTKIAFQLIIPVVLILATVVLNGFVSWYLMNQQKHEEATAARESNEAQAQNIKEQLNSQQKAIDIKFERQMLLIESQEASADGRQELSFRQLEDSAETERSDLQFGFCLKRAEYRRGQKAKIYDELSDSIINYQKTVMFGPLEFLLVKDAQKNDLTAQKISILRSFKRSQIFREILESKLSKTIPFFGIKIKKSVIKLLIALEELEAESSKSMLFYYGLLNQSEASFELPKDEELVTLVLQHSESYKLLNSFESTLMTDMANEISGEGIECVK